VTRKSMDSLDAVEIVMVFEEIFETELPVNDAESLGGPTEVVDWLELRLSNQRPNK
jgi:acyl carrier protein